MSIQLRAVKTTFMSRFKQKLSNIAKGKIQNMLV